MDLDGQPDVGEQALDPVDVPGPLADEPVAFAVGLAAIVVLDRGDADDRPDVVLAESSGRARVNQRIGSVRSRPSKRPG